MPVARLFAALFFAALSLTTALAEEKSSPTELSSSVVTLSKSTAPSSTFDDLLSSNQWQLSKSNFDATCYTMRTYMLKKDAPDSDSVHPIGYTTCQPSLQYQMKVTRKPVEPKLAR